MEIRSVSFGIILIFFFCESASDFHQQPEYHHPKTTTRAKRVFWGTPLRNENSYAVMKYIVYITNGSCRSGVLRVINWIFGTCEPVNESFLQCGGALISEHIVQTACHCVSFFSLLNYTHAKTTLRDVWEHAYLMYMGYSDIIDMTGGSRALMFITHQKCEQLQTYPGSGGGDISHDFGIIVAQDPLLKRELFIREAPIYTETEMRKIYQRVQSEQRVCLLVGWGENRVVMNLEYYLQWHLSLASRYLHHAWNHVRSYRQCYNKDIMVAYYLDWAKRGGMLKYKEFVTWICTKWFGRRVGTVGPGDSGSPVTCDNEYVALVTAGSVPHNLEKEYFPTLGSKHSALRFSLWENAVEYRRAFLTATAELVREKENEDIPLLKEPGSRSLGVRVYFIPIIWSILSFLIGAFFNQ